MLFRDLVNNELRRIGARALACFACKLSGDSAAFGGPSRLSCPKLHLQSTHTRGTRFRACEITHFRGQVTLRQESGVLQETNLLNKVQDFVANQISHRHSPCVFHAVTTLKTRRDSFWGVFTITDALPALDPHRALQEEIDMLLPSPDNSIPAGRVEHSLREFSRHPPSFPS